MKILTIAGIITLCLSTAQAQHGLPQGTEQTLWRLEQAFNTNDTRDLKWVLPASIRMRIEDSSFSAITDAYVMEMLHRYLAEKDSLEFKFTGALISEVDARHTSGLLTDIRFMGRGGITETVYIATGKLFYGGADRREHVEVTVFLLGASIAGIDISRTPRGTVFFTSPYN